MKNLKLPSGKSKAQAMLEFAIVLPILLLVVYGLIETGRLLFIYSSVNNATRQASRYGSTSGVNPDNSVERFRDCDGIRDAAERLDFLNTFNAYDLTDFVIEYDRPTTTEPDPAPYYTCTGSVVPTSVPVITGDRITVRINAAFNAIIPNLVPFISQTINAESSRTLLLTISIQPPKENTVTLITADNPDASEVGQPVTVSVTVTADTTPTGNVNITGADSNCTITLSNGSGSCVVIFTSLGSKTLTAYYVGDDTHNPSSDTESHTVVPTTTETTITADTPDPSLIGATVTVEVEVKNANTWGTTPTGTVTISGADGTVPTCTINLNNGSGNCNVNFATDGTKTLTATYNPTSTHSTSSDTEEHVVISPADTITTILSDSPDPSGINQNVTVTFAVTGSSTPTGTVTITGQNSGCATPVTLSGGTGSCTVSFSSVGTKTLTATYTPNSTAFNPSSDTESHVVQLFPTTTTITADTPDPSDIGQNVNVTVTVTGGATTPTGTVAITGADTNCNITLSGGTGSCSVVFSSGGTRTLTATYSGSGTHAASSDTETHVVVQQPVVGCNTTNITVGLLQRTADGAMMMNINNSLTVPLQIGNVSVTWNHDKGNKNGPDQTIRLQNARLGNVFWTGNEIGPTYTITPASTFIPSGTSTIIFAFHQVFDRWDNTESITINLSSPGCEGVILFQNQNSGN